MTVGNMVAEIYNELGEHDDCDPYVGGVLTPASPGYQRILAWIQKAYNHVATFKFRNGRQLHFRELEREDRLKTVKELANVFAVIGNTVIGPDANYAAGLFVGWVAEDPLGNRAEVMSSTPSGGGYLVLETDIPLTLAPTDTLTLYRRSYPIRTGLGYLEWNFSARPLEITRIFDLSQNIELTRRDRSVALFEGRRDVGDPAQYALRMSNIVFDRAFDDERWVLVEYYALPDPLSTTDIDDEPILPESYHLPIKTLALWFGMLQKEELTDAYKMWSNFETIMAEVRSTSELEDDAVGKTYRVATEKL